MRDAFPLLGGVNWIEVCKMPPDESRYV